MSEAASMLSVGLTERMVMLPSDLRAMILSRKNHVDHVRTLREKRPDHWYAEQHRAVQTLELAERMASAVARNPEEFVRWAGMHG